MRRRELRLLARPCSWFLVKQGCLCARGEDGRPSETPRHRGGPRPIPWPSLRDPLSLPLQEGVSRKT